jgi:hypothetical protein
VRQLIPPAEQPSLESIVSACILRVRANDSPLPQYLASRSIAGCTGSELVTSAMLACPGKLTGWFEPWGAGHRHADSKATADELLTSIASHLSAGRAAVVSLNLQLYGNDAWHHQCVYAVDAVKRQVWCTNPMESYTAEDLLALVTTPSVLLVRRDDILSRQDRAGADRTVFDRPEWQAMQVAEQIQALKLSDASTTHVAIPAAYVGGVAVFEVSVKHDA